MLQMGQHLFLSSPLLPSCLLSCAHRIAEWLRLGGTSADHLLQPSGYEKKHLRLRGLRKQDNQRHLGIQLKKYD